MSSSSLQQRNVRHFEIDTRSKPVILESAFRHICPVSVLVLQGSSRMSKIKMRCITCGKWFQSANAKEVTCPECTQKARKEKMAAKTGPATPDKAAGTTTPARVVPPPPKPKPASSGSHWFDSISDIKVSEPEKPPLRPKIPSSPVPRDNRGGPGSSGGYHDRDERGPGGPGGYRDREGANRDRGPGGYREGEHRGPG